MKDQKSKRKPFMLYLDENELKSLKILAINGNKSASQFIRDLLIGAIRNDISSRVSQSELMTNVIPQQDDDSK